MITTYTPVLYRRICPHFRHHHAYFYGNLLLLPLVLVSPYCKVVPIRYEIMEYNSLTMGDFDYAVRRCGVLHRTTRQPTTLSSLNYYVPGSCVWWCTSNTSMAPDTAKMGATLDADELSYLRQRFKQPGEKERET